MHRSRLLAVLLVLSAFMFSCSGEDGATGPAGPAGKDGNANVICFSYPAQTSGGLFNYPFTATVGMVDSCMILGFYQPSTFPTYWYAVPGFGPAAAYQTRFSLAPAGTDAWNYQVVLLSPTGGSYTASTTFNTFKLFLVPPSSITVMTSRGVNLLDCEAVSAFLNLNE